MAYAETTTVSVSKTKADIETMIQNAGADQFVSGFKDNMAIIGFTLSNRQIRFVLPLPLKSDFEFTPGHRKRQNADVINKAWAQACRSKWRSLYLIIKAKLEAVESGISTVEREFFYDIVLPDGQTIGQFMAPQIEEAYETGQMPPMLPMFNN